MARERGRIIKSVSQTAVRYVFLLLQYKLYAQIKTAFFGKTFGIAVICKWLLRVVLLSENGVVGIPFELFVEEEIEVQSARAQRLVVIRVLILYAAAGETDCRIVGLRPSRREERVIQQLLLA